MGHFFDYELFTCEDCVFFCIIASNYQFLFSLGLRAILFILFCLCGFLDYLFSFSFARTVFLLKITFFSFSFARAKENETRENTPANCEAKIPFSGAKSMNSHWRLCN